MDIDLLMKALTVKIKCKQFEGTGFLLQSETENYSYVVTAKHCLEGDNEEEKQEYSVEDIEVYRCTSDEKFISIKVNESYTHIDPKIDIALIMVAHIDDIPDLYIDRPVFDENCYLYGFPKVLKESDSVIKHEIISAKISGSGIDNGIIELKPLIRQETTGDRTANNIEGFSGSAIIGCRDESMILFGVFVELKIRNTPHNTYNGYCNERICEIIHNNSLKALIPHKLLSFSSYLDKSFELFNYKIRKTLKDLFKNEIAVVPLQIIKDLNNKLTIPYCENSYLNERMWYGWAKLIILLHIIGIDPKQYSEINYHSGTKELFHIHFLFSKLRRSEEAFRELFKKWEEYGTSMQDNTIIVLNSENPPYDKFYTKTMMQGIVKNIGEDILFEKGINIANPQSYKIMSGLHIDYLSEQIDSRIVTEENPTAVNAKIKEIIIEVIENVTL